MTGKTGKTNLHAATKRQRVHIKRAASGKVWFSSGKSSKQRPLYKRDGAFSIPDLVFLPIFEAFETASVTYDESADFLS